MQPFTALTAVAMPLDIANVDTDKLIPARFLRKLRTPDRGYDAWLFHDMRFDANGNERPEFVLNQAPYREARILVADVNFGCGSSREGAAYAMLDYGFRAVIAASFGDIHYANEIQNGMLPAIVPQSVCKDLRDQLHANPGAELTIELEPQTITDTRGVVHRFEIDPVYKERLLKGLDEVGMVLQHLPEIEAFEQRHYSERPWIR